MVIVEHLAGVRQQRLHVLPSPVGPSAEDTQSHRVLGQPASLWDLLQGFSQGIVTLPLGPAEQMPDAVAVQQVEPKPFSLVPGMALPGATGSIARLPGAAPARAVGAGRSIGPVKPEPQYRTTKATGGPAGPALIHLVTRRGHIQPAESLGALHRAGVQALTPARDATETAKQGRGRLRGDLCREVDRRLLSIELQAPRVPLQHVVEGITAPLAMTTRARRALECHRPHQRLDRSRARRAGLQWTLTRLTVQRSATACVLIMMGTPRLGHACGERRAQPQNRLAHLG